MEMKQTGKWIYSAFLSAAIILFSGCTQFSEHESDSSAGINGGFELVKNELPVNWLMYTPNTVPDADFDILLDQQDFKEGKQSLKFEVRACSGAAGWHAPGFTNEFLDSGTFEGPNKYLVSFWLKNEGTKFNISAGGVAAKEGGIKTLIETEQQLEDWSYYEFVVDIPEDRWLRLQLNILKPGSFWIDDIKIVKI